VADQTTLQLIDFKTNELLAVVSVGYKASPSFVFSFDFFFETLRFPLANMRVSLIGSTSSSLPSHCLRSI